MICETITLNSIFLYVIHIQNHALVLIQHGRLHEFFMRKDTRTTRPKVELNPSYNEFERVQSVVLYQNKHMVLHLLHTLHVFQ